MRNRSFLALCALIFVNQLGFGIVVPVLPSFARSFGLDAASVGLVIGIYGFARFLANVPAGQIAERRGRRDVLIIGTAITSIASALMAASGNLAQLLAFRLLAGLGAATVLTGGQIMVGDLATPAHRGRMMSTYQGFFLVGAGLGPVPGGLLADHFGLRSPLVAYAVFSALACVAALFLIRETKPAVEPEPREDTPGEEMQPRTRTGLRTVLTSRPFLLISSVTFAQFFARTGAIFTVMPLLGTEKLHLSSSQVGYAAGLINLLQVATLYHSGLLADRFGRKPVIAPASIVAGAALVMFAWSPTYAFFLFSAAVWGFSAGLSGPAPAAYVADFAPADKRGPVYGAWRSVSDCGYIIGPLLLGLLIDHFNYSVPMLLTAVLVLVSGALFWAAAPELHQRARPVEVAR